ncbi:MAG: hypothetical protein GEV06_21715, partial [Luteitalea sp.]|nr:hypothetical protein [Luteitalea sp.]
MKCCAFSALALRFIVSVLVLVLPTAPEASAQSTMGGIRGVVSDATGGVLPGVTVTVVNVRTGATRVAVTDEAGRYLFSSLAAAPYTLSVEMQGFAPVTRDGIELAVSQTIDVDFTLRPAGLEEGITVTAEAPVVNTATSELGSRFDTKHLTELPINGRDYARFSLLTPGAVARSSFIADLTFNGLHGVHNSFTIDGIDASRVDQPYMGNGYERGARLLTGSLDSVQEF